MIYYVEQANKVMIYDGSLEQANKVMICYDSLKHNPANWQIHNLL